MVLYYWILMKLYIMHYKHLVFQIGLYQKKTNIHFGLLESNINNYKLKLYCTTPFSYKIF